MRVCVQEEEGKRARAKEKKNDNATTALPRRRLRRHCSPFPVHVRADTSLNNT
jgi:hypothetical protein